MADAERTTGAPGSGDAEGLNTVREEVDEKEETSPLMPHLTYSDVELDRLYPRLEAPEDEQLDDLQEDADDHVYQHGLGVAAAIRTETEMQGRKRRPETETAPAANASQASCSTAAPKGGPGSQEEPGGGVNGKNRDGERRQRWTARPTSGTPATRPTSGTPAGRRQRTRRPTSSAATDGPGSVQLVESPEESTNSSSLGRRRSARDRLPPPCSCYSFLGALCSYEHSAPIRVRLLVRSDERTE